MTAVTLSTGVGVAVPALAPVLAAQAQAQEASQSRLTATQEEVRAAYGHLSKEVEEQVHKRAAVASLSVV